MTALAGFPGTFQYDDNWASPAGQRDIVRNGKPKISSSGMEKLEELWGSDFYLKISIVRIVERVTNFALTYCGKCLISHTALDSWLIRGQLRSNVQAKGYRGLEAEYVALDSDIRSQQESIPPLSDPRGLRASESVSTFNPHILQAHMSLYGSGLILWGLRAGEDETAERQMLESLHALAAICELIQTHRRLGRFHAPITSMLPMRNAVRVLASQMRRAEVKRNVALFSNYSSVMDLLLDFLDDMTRRYHEWSDVTLPLKDTLTATAKSLAAS
ncbi:hypothetical protein DL93DRAFT_1684834 [Clavulina sp. PMI_390]|nr:hypothetical protein DL93DRAFT_1684834 [Clavulina sp. PMI_390]